MNPPRNVCRVCHAPQWSGDREDMPRHLSCWDCGAHLVQWPNGVCTLSVTTTPNHPQMRLYAKNPH